MTDTIKRLYGPTQLSNSAADTYTVPASTNTVVKEIIVANTTAGQVNFTASIGNDAAGTRIVPTVAIPANTVTIFDIWLPLTTGEKIQAYSSAATSLTMTITGVEVT